MIVGVWFLGWSPLHDGVDVAILGAGTAWLLLKINEWLDIPDEIRAKRRKKREIGRAR